MFIRIVKMSFHQENIPKFLANFDLMKNKIRGATGNRFLELYQDKNNKDRLVEIDRYYIAKYKAEIRVLKTFIFFCCLALIGSIFYNKGMISMLLFTIYTGLLFLVMFIVIARDLINIFLRDSTNFDEYDYSFFYKPKRSGVMYKTYNAGELSKIPTCAA